ncbi:hypothetical protein [Thiorhodococcus minor]|uniref:PilZ domain-containing protein n=1 Tax=Thiorhodococcus minor TaxID=57489 RepID=A0A6M0JZJ8_9GAMM|nr:hypothetical protein [Thiorhodococcus minor]NEV62093.1 hypothetical protein [Thiorhodococcus minor]
METRNAAERRRHPRFGLMFDVQMQKSDAAEYDPHPMSHLGMSRGVSESGIRVWASCAHPIQSRLLLTFECPEMGWNKITSRVGQVWCGPRICGPTASVSWAFASRRAPRSADLTRPERPARQVRGLRLSNRRCIRLDPPLAQV